MNPIRMDRVESAVRVIIEWIDVFNQHDSGKLGILMAEDVILDASAPAPTGQTYSGKAAVTQYFADVFDKYPQVKMEAEALSGYGTRGILQWNMHLSDSADRPEKQRGITLFSVRDGKILEMQSYVKQ